jgi:hypothetical protein
MLLYVFLVTFIFVMNIYNKLIAFSSASASASVDDISSVTDGSIDTLPEDTKQMKRMIQALAFFSLLYCRLNKNDKR